MSEIKLKSLTLFLFESIMLQGGRIIDRDFETELNDFIYKCYNEQEELLSLIFDRKALSGFVENKYDVLTLEQIVQLVNKYYGTDRYLKLVEDVGYETDQKINELAIKFTSYCNEIMNLYYADTSLNYPKGYPKILQ